MKVNKSVSLDFRTIDNIRDFMIRNNLSNFSKALNILTNLGFSQWEKQNSEK